MGAVARPWAVQDRMNVWAAKAVFLKDQASADPTCDKKNPKRVLRSKGPARYTAVR